MVSVLSNKIAVELEQVLTASDDGRSDSVARLARSLRDPEFRARPAELRSVLARATVPSLDYTSAQFLHRAYRELQPVLASAASASADLRVAVLGSSNIDSLADFLELFLFATGSNVKTYRPDYGVLRQEILSPESGLYEFSPNVIIIVTSWRDLGHLPLVTDSREAVAARIDAEMHDWSALWTTIHARVGCPIIQTSFSAPPWRILGNFDTRHCSGLARYVALVNQTLIDQAPAYLTIHDTAHTASQFGLWGWADESFYHQAKLPCAPEALVDFAHSLGSVTAAHFGLSKKCLVLDLDNTLWGGVIGDEGLHGIRLGAGDAEGEAFHAFQRYVKGLQSRGVLLAVCSKNEESIAREAFERHSGMVLRLTDVASFIANWEDKPANLCTIAKQLNIGLNSLVFVDDNPAERAMVRQMLPDVSVPELPEDPAAYVRAIDRHRYFEVVSLATEDFQRTQFYRGNEERERAQVAAGSVDEFLTTLEMQATIQPITFGNVDRCAQLIGRSNQFNLTTRRYSAAEVLRVAECPDWITAAVSLRDRFGDNGLISVLLAKVTAHTLEIDTWLMSCRVLKRGVEGLLLNHLFDVAVARGVAAIRGEYIPTAKNALVKDHYRKLGFQCLEQSPDGRSQWVLAISPEWDRCRHQITEVEGA